MLARRNYWFAIALVAALAAAAPVSGVSSRLVDDFYDLHERLEFSDLVITSDCDTGSIEAGQDDRAFRFSEEAAAEQSVGTGCAAASFAAALPEGTDHIHVRFQADRVISGAGGELPVAPAFIQEVQVLDASGIHLYATPYFATEAGPSAMTFFDLPPYPMPAGVTDVIVRFVFADAGRFGAVPASITDYSATVRNASVEFSSVPAEVNSHEHGTRTGGVDFLELELTAIVPAAYTERFDVDLRVRVDRELSFTRLITPDGTELTGTQTRTEVGVSGFHPNVTLIEQLDSRVKQVTIPHGIIKHHGPGEYRLFLVQAHTVSVDAPLVPFAFLALLTPLPFAVMGFWYVYRYEQDTFGLYRRSARQMRLGITFAVLYYGVILAAALTGGRLRAMASWPFGLEAWLLYAQTILAVGAFVGFWMAARALDRITGPMARERRKSAQRP